MPTQNGAGRFTANGDPAEPSNYPWLGEPVTWAGAGAWADVLLDTPSAAASSGNLGSRRYTEHSLDLRLSGGLAEAAAAAWSAPSLARESIVRRVRGRDVAAVVAAAMGAAEVGRRTLSPGQGSAQSRSPVVDRSGSASSTRREPSVSPGPAGVAQAAGWALGLDDLGGRRQAWRLARMLQPARGTHTLARAAAVATGAGASRSSLGRALRRPVAIWFTLAGLSGFWGRIAIATTWVGMTLGVLGSTVALARSDAFDSQRLVAVDLGLVVTAVLAGTALTVIAAVSGARRQFSGLWRHHYGLVPGVGPAPRAGVLRRSADRAAGQRGAAGLPAIVTWLTDRLDDIAGIPVPGSASGVQVRHTTLTYADLWLGRTGLRQIGDPERLRKAALDPAERVVDVQLEALNTTTGKVLMLPEGLAEDPLRGFCPVCWARILPPRVLAQCEAASPRVSLDVTCPIHREHLVHHLPAAADWPLAAALRMAACVPGLMFAVPVVTTLDVDGSGAWLRTEIHWFTQGGSAEVGSTRSHAWPDVDLGVLHDRAEVSSPVTTALGAAVGGRLKGPRSPYVSLREARAWRDKGLADAAAARRALLSDPAPAVQTPTFVSGTGLGIGQSKGTQANASHPNGSPATRRTSPPVETFVRSPTPAREAPDPAPGRADALQTWLS